MANRIEIGLQRLNPFIKRRKKFEGNSANLELDSRMVYYLYVEKSAGDLALASPEAPIEIKKFSAEQKEALEKQGFVIYGLTGQYFKTLKGVRREPMDPLAKQQDSNIDFEAIKSMRSEVAINFNRLFLGSGNESLEEQRVMISEFSNKLENKVPGVKAIMGNVFDYAELAYVFDVVREGEDGAFFAPEIYLKGYARTNTIVDERTAVVNFYNTYRVGEQHIQFGDRPADRGRLYVNVSSWPADRGNPRVYAAPLVVPV